MTFTTYERAQRNAAIIETPPHGNPCLQAWGGNAALLHTFCYTVKHGT